MIHGNRSPSPRLAPCSPLHACTIAFLLIRLFLDNAYRTIILQASPTKYLIEHELVKKLHLIKYERVKNYK
jgi:hypothetical protein